MPIEKISNEESASADEKLEDLSTTEEQADETKGGSISLNYTKVEFKNIGMGTANE